MSPHDNDCQLQLDCLLIFIKFKFFVFRLSNHFDGNVRYYITWKIIYLQDADYLFFG